MATEGTDLSRYKEQSVPDGSAWRIGIVVSAWNPEITTNLANGASQTLVKHGVKPENIQEFQVPGSFELPLGAQFLLEHGNVDAVIAVGSVVRGATAHFDFVCSSAAQGIKDVSLKFGKPVIFCVLTDDNIQQAQERSGGRLGNKGIESAVAALKMVGLSKRLSAG